MKLKIIQYDGKELKVEVKRFEFRTNRVENWILVVYEDDRQEVFR